MRTPMTGQTAGVYGVVAVIMAAIFGGLFSYSTLPTTGSYLSMPEYVSARLTSPAFLEFTRKRHEKDQWLAEHGAGLRMRKFQQALVGEDVRDIDSSADLLARHLKHVWRDLQRTTVTPSGPGRYNPGRSELEDLRSLVGSAHDQYCALQNVSDEWRCRSGRWLNELAMFEDTFRMASLLNGDALAVDPSLPIEPAWFATLATQERDPPAPGNVFVTVLAAWVWYSFWFAGSFVLLMLMARLGKVEDRPHLLSQPNRYYWPVLALGAPGFLAFFIPGLVAFGAWKLFSDDNADLQGF